MSPDEIILTIKNLSNPAKDINREVYPEAQTLRALGVDLPAEIKDRRPIPRTAKWMIKALAERLKQVAPEIAAQVLDDLVPGLGTIVKDLPKNPIQIDPAEMPAPETVVGDEEEDDEDTKEFSPL